MTILETKNLRKNYSSFSLCDINLSINGGEITALPSMRVLAKNLRVSVITVQKAYENLSREGFITTGVGRGTFVSDIKESVLKEKNLSLVEEAVKDATEKAKRGGIGKEEVIALFEKHFESEVVNDNSRNKES